ncbi:MAG: hypothetical protein IBJ13_14460 [Sphingopyxis sp.]|nr:hypothetical protein [Sphingopyxis sp.]
MIDKDAPEIADPASSETMIERSIEASEDGQDDPQIIAADAVPSPAPVFYIDAMIEPAFGCGRLLGRAASQNVSHS